MFQAYRNSNVQRCSMSSILGAILDILKRHNQISTSRHSKEAPSQLCLKDVLRPQIMRLSSSCKKQEPLLPYFVGMFHPSKKVFKVQPVMQEICEVHDFFKATLSSVYPTKEHPYHPWDWYIYLHECLIFMGFHVGKYTSPMDASWDILSPTPFRSQETAHGVGWFLWCLKSIHKQGWALENVSPASNMPLFIWICMVNL